MKIPIVYLSCLTAQNALITTQFEVYPYKARYYKQDGLWCNQWKDRENYLWKERCQKGFDQKQLVKCIHNDVEYIKINKTNTLSDATLDDIKSILKKHCE